MRFDIRFWICRTVGALAGIPVGLFGVILGFVVGFLIDQLIRSRNSHYRIRAFLRNPIVAGPREVPASLIAVAGLGIYLGSDDGTITVRKYRLLRDACVRWFPELRDRPDDLDRMLNVCAACEGAIDGNALAHLLAPSIAHDAGDAGTIAAAEIEHLFADLCEVSLREPKELVRLRETCDRVRVDFHAVAALSTPFYDFVGAQPEDSQRALTPLNAEDCAILGVGTDATLVEVKRVFRILASQFHPDAVTELDESRRAASEQAFIRIRSAYDSLLNQLNERAVSSSRRATRETAAYPTSAPDGARTGGAAVPNC